MMTLRSPGHRTMLRRLAAILALVALPAGSAAAAEPATADTDPPVGSVTVTTGGLEGLQALAATSGEVWFASQDGKGITRLTVADGYIANFTTNMRWAITDGVIGPDGNLWFAGNPPGTTGGGIGVFNTRTWMASYYTAGFTQTIFPQQLTVGPDGNLWFTSWVGTDPPRFGKFDLASQAVALYELPTLPGGKGRSVPCDITAGPDGNLWVASCQYLDANSSPIAQMAVLRYDPDNPSSPTAIVRPTVGTPTSIAVGPDGHIWFTEESGWDYDTKLGRGGIGRIIPAATPILAEFTAGIIAGSEPTGITAGADGNIWVARPQAGSVGVITPTGDFTHYPLSPNVWGIIAGSDGAMYLGGSDGQVVRVQTAATPALSPPDLGGGGRSGDPLTCSAAKWALTPSLTSTAWYAKGTGGSLASGSQYIPDAGMIGKSVTCQVTATFPPATGLYAPMTASSSPITITEGPPQVSAITPESAPAEGGGQFKITGANFVPGTTVTFTDEYDSGAQATNLEVQPDTILGQIPPERSTSYAQPPLDIVVVTPDGQSDTLRGVFKYTHPAAPQITSVSPANGSTSGGRAQVNGSGFDAGTVVRFGENVAANLTVDPGGTSIGVTVPPGAVGTVPVTVTGPDGSNQLVNAYSYDGSPRITRVTPSSGPASGGTPITITGSGFAAGADVTLDPGATGSGSAVPATDVKVVDATTITAVTPAVEWDADTAWDAVVSNSATNADARADAPFTYRVAPTLTAIETNRGSTGGGTQITATGTNIAPRARVAVGGRECTGVTVTAGESVTCTTAASRSTGPVDVVVTNPDGQSATLPGAFEYFNPAPGLQSLQPGTGPVAGGTQVSLQGSGLHPEATVTIAGVPATDVRVASDGNSLAALTGRYPGRLTAPCKCLTGDVVLTNPDGQVARLKATFEYQESPGPALSGISPADGPLGGGTAVELDGANFTGSLEVTIGGKQATAVTVADTTTVRVLTPAMTAAGPTDVVVTDALGRSATLPGAFRYDADPPTPPASPTGSATSATSSALPTGAPTASTPAPAASSTSASLPPPPPTTATATATATATPVSGSPSA